MRHVVCELYPGPGPGMWEGLKKMIPWWQNSINQIACHFTVLTYCVPASASAWAAQVPYWTGLSTHFKILLEPMQETVGWRESLCPEICASHLLFLPISNSHAAVLLGFPCCIHESSTTMVTKKKRLRKLENKGNRKNKLQDKTQQSALLYWNTIEAWRTATGWFEQQRRNVLKQTLSFLTMMAIKKKRSRKLEEKATEWKSWSGNHRKSWLFVCLWNGVAGNLFERQRALKED